MANRGRPVALEIKSSAIQELMDDNDLSTLTQMSKQTGLPLTTLHSWAQGKKSPLDSINLCLKLLKLGKTLEELKEIFEQAAEESIPVLDDPEVA